MELFTSAQGLPWGPGVRILACDPEGLLAVEKPAGLLSHPNEAGDISRSLLQVPYDPDREAYTTAVGQVYLLHRLDSPTSGVVLMASNDWVAGQVRQLFREKQVQKLYMAWCWGAGGPDQGVWTDGLSRRQDEQGHLRVGSGGGQAAQTRFHCIARAQFAARSAVLLKLWPQTGRTHQLRVQSALHGLPIIGDAQYGNFEANAHLRKTGGPSGLFLHAYSVELNLPLLKGGVRRFYAHSPLPQYWGRLYAGNKRGHA